ncbi:hypothetical protein ABMA27_000801 [Loxostege sticticalis]|uniref:Uncharacterized protein n=1 Tax=Loxostege sticticalis TaxID=481309 RepID=A0ABR3I0D1_LOXSC
MGVEMAAEAEEKKPDRPPSKTNAIYPVLNKYSEKTASVKELTTSKISMHKENTVSKESSTHSTVTHTNKTESEKLIHNETVTDGTLDGQIKKPPVPLKKSPTPTAGVGGLFSGLKSKMLSSTDKEKSSSTTVSSGSSSGGEWDRPDGGAASKPHASTLDHVERNSMLNDPRANRVKAPRRRPPSQALRDDTPQQIGLSNGHEVPTEKPPTATEKAEEIKPRAREWEKHKAPWMEELKLNQAKKTSSADGKARSVSTPAEGGLASKAGGGSTDRILECGLEEKRSSHSMEMSKSTSSISSRMSILESFDETTKVRHSLDSKKELNANREDPPPAKPTLNSPTAAGRTLLNMLDEIKKPQAPPPPIASTRPPPEPAEKTPAVRTEKPHPVPEKMVSSTEKIVASSEKLTENIITRTSGIFEKSNTLERVEKDEKIPEKINKTPSGTLERRLHSLKAEKTEPVKQDKTEKFEKSEGPDALIAQLNSRISNLEKIIEVQNSMFTAAVEELTSKLKAESEKRQALQAEVEKLAHCVTQV